MQSAFGGDAFASAGYKQEVLGSKASILRVLLRPQQFEAWLAANARGVIVRFSEATICAGLCCRPVRSFRMAKRSVYNRDLDVGILQIQSSGECGCASAMLHEDNLLRASLERGLRRLQQEFSGTLLKFRGNAAYEATAGDSAKFRAKLILRGRGFGRGDLPCAGCRLRCAAQRFLDQLHGQDSDPGVHAGWMLLGRLLRRP